MFYNDKKILRTCLHHFRLKYGSPSLRKILLIFTKQGRIHGNPVADGWAGAVMRKPLELQKCDGPTDIRTDIPTDTARCRATKNLH